MAITKIKPIRGTVNKALAYILDPQKTDDQLYVAAKEFEWTRNLAAQQGMQMPKVIARHLIQSFAVDEVTPEQAHEIGKQFADEWLKGKYEYVIATHIDKGHCHNHIIFNAVNYVDFHARCGISLMRYVLNTGCQLFLPLMEKAWTTRNTPKPNAVQVGSKNSSRPLIAV